MGSTISTGTFLVIHQNTMVIRQHQALSFTTFVYLSSLLGWTKSFPSIIWANLQIWLATTNSQQSCIASETVSLPIQMYMWFVHGSLQSLGHIYESDVIYVHGPLVRTWVWTGIVWFDNMSLSSVGCTRLGGSNDNHLGCILIRCGLCSGLALFVCATKMTLDWLMALESTQAHNCKFT